MKLKYSKQRDALFRLLKSVKNHPTAEWLYMELKSDHPNLSLATVYRNLNVLQSCGDVIKIEVGDGTIRYDADTSNHCHFICSKCGAVSDIELVSIQKINDEAQRLNGIIVTNSSIVFHGLCSKCK